MSSTEGLPDSTHTPSKFEIAQCTLNNGSVSLLSTRKESNMYQSTNSSSDESPIMTAEELIRRKRRSTVGSQSSAVQKQKSNTVNEDDLDEEIKRLEAELEKSSDESDDGSSSSSDSGSDDTHSAKKRKYKGGESTSDPSTSKDAIICLSSCASETIEPLATSYLPACKSKKLKIDKDEEKQKDREKNSRVSSGLRDAVKEVLAEYQPRSSERIPFYCRVCAVQSKDEAEFTLHKQTEFHKTAVQVEKKATYCKLCRKQLTSLIQMQEHLDSRPHKERLDSMKARQQGFSGRGFGRGGSAAGRGNRYVQVNKERPGRR